MSESELLGDIRSSGDTLETLRDSRKKSKSHQINRDDNESLTLPGDFKLIVSNTGLQKIDGK